MEMKRSLHNVQKYTKYIKNERHYSSKTLSKKFNDLAAFLLQNGI